MSGWVVVTVLGAVFALVIVVLLVVVSRAVMRTAANASQLMTALEEVRAKTEVLADLEARSGEAARLATDATAALARFQNASSPSEHESGQS